jgi:hypothetical protein
MTTVLGAQRPKVMTVTEAETIKDRVCGPRPRFGRRQAQLIAVRRNTARQPGTRAYNAYRCPFSEGRHHWHVGRIITVAGMSEVAQAIRALRQAA